MKFLLGFLTGIALRSYIIELFEFINYELDRRL